MSNDAALKSVKRGDSPEVIFQVGDINAIHRHVRNAKQGIGNASNDELRSRESWRMKAKNTTVTDLDRGVFVSLDGVLYSEADNGAEFKNRPTANIVALATGKVIAITADFIDAGNIGPVVTAGIWNAEVFVNATSHKYASIVAGVMTSQQGEGPVSIISAPATTGVQNCVVLLGGNSGSGYNGPYKVTATSATAVSIGGDRAVAGYAFKDVTTAWQSDGTPVAIAKTAAESGGVLSGLTVSVYVYYACQRNSGSTWSMTPMVSAVWPPADTTTNKDQIFLIVAFVTMSGGVITDVGQLLRGCPAIWERPILCNGEAVYANDQASVTGMIVNLGAQSQAISAGAFNLSSNAVIYVEATYTVATDTWSITSTYQSAASITFRSLTSGVYTLKWAVAEIASGRIYQRHYGNIEYPNVSIASITGGMVDGDDDDYDTDTDVPIASDSTGGGGTAQLYAQLDQITGWNASAIQSLWNVNGVLTWLTSIEIEDALKDLDGYTVDTDEYLKHEGSTNNIEWQTS